MDLGKELKEEEMLTHALELLFELGLVLAVGDPKVVIRVLALVHRVGGRGGSNGHDCGGPLGPLGLADGFDVHHFTDHRTMLAC